MHGISKFYFPQDSMKWGSSIWYSPQIDSDNDESYSKFIKDLYL